MTQATRLFHDKAMLPDGAIEEMVFWRVPVQVPHTTHELKYRLFHGLDGQGIVAAWHQAEQGRPVDETHMTFPDLGAMLATLSLRRLEQLRRGRQHGAKSTRSLADALGRDAKRQR